MSTADFRQIKQNLRLSYDAGAEQRDRESKAAWKLAEREAFAGRLAAAGARRLLEVGAGAGQDSAYFAGRGFDVVATDLSAGMAARCRAKGLSTLVADVCAPAFAAAAFDAVYTVNCLLHVPTSELPTVLAGLRRVLRPGGLFFVGCYGGGGTEGVATDDNHVPARYFAFRADAELAGIARQQFEIVDFHVVPVGRPHWFQSLTVRRPAEQAGGE